MIGKTPSQLHAEQVDAFMPVTPASTRLPREEAKLAAPSANDVTATELAGDPIVAKLVRAPGNDAPIGGLKARRTARSAPVGHGGRVLQDLRRVLQGNRAPGRGPRPLQLVSDALNG